MAEGGQLSLPEHVPSVQFSTLAPVQASAAGLPLPVHRIYTNICFPAQKKGDTQHLTGLHFAILPGPARRFFTQKP